MSVEPAVLRQRIDDALAAEVARMVARLTTHHSVMEPLGTSLRQFVSNGKRIRPILLLLGFQAAGRRDVDAVLGPALALELLHTCALVHDDVIDRASTRRGKPTVHMQFEQQHAAHDWAGDPRGFGTSVAILVGDLAFVYADELFMQASVEPQRLLDGFGWFTRLREEVMAGQYLDLHSAITRTHDRELALTVATMKSGRYSVTRPLQVGAALGGASDHLLDGLLAFGDPLGRAFQVRDDLLGLFGDEAATGKSAWSDLAEGKRTLLVAEALARLDPHDRQLLDDELGRPGLSEDDALRLRDLIVDSGARDVTERYVTEAIAQAREALEALDIPSASRDALATMTDELGFRSR